MNSWQRNLILILTVKHHSEPGRKWAAGLVLKENFCLSGSWVGPFGTEATAASTQAFTDQWNSVKDNREYCIWSNLLSDTINYYNPKEQKQKHKQYQYSNQYLVEGGVFSS